jgi:SAM-dependent methyltransferase
MGSRYQFIVPVPPPREPVWLSGPYEPSQITRLLYARLDEDDVAAIRRRLHEAPELNGYYLNASSEVLRAGLLLKAGVWLEMEQVMAKTELTSAEPPAHVHAMARGQLAAGGALYEADMVADALAGAGVDLGDIGSALDFGCSSGRVLRPLRAAHPHVDWHGCDPNATAIAWARGQLPDAELLVSDDEPPLALADASLDLAYAISIWSHFEPELGLRWFEEMRRVIRPGGHLVCTVHGLSAVDYYLTNEMRTPEQSREIADALYTRGWWYASEFGAEGDWGVVNPRWGSTFLSPEWVLTQLCPRWRVLEFVPGRNQDNQDVYVLQRV